MKKLWAVVAATITVSTAGAAGATTYTSDPVLAHFLTGSYATFSNYCCGDAASPYTPTDATVSAGLRVYGGGSLTGLSTSNNWILATLPSASSSIRVFANIDHFGAQYDGYQYTIAGSNDGTTWTPLFDALSVVGASEPFTLGSFTGTAPTTVNNVLTPGAGPGGDVGYIADFTFGAAYKWYAFGASTVAFAQGNADQELSGVSPLRVSRSVPEPSTWALLLAGVFATGATLRRRARTAH